MQIHIGNIIKDYLKNNGITQIFLAREINVTPENVRSIFKRETIDTGLLLRISEALNHDFFQYYKVNLQQEDKEPAPEEELTREVISAYRELLLAERENTKHWKEAFFELSKIKGKKR